MIENTPHTKGRRTMTYRTVDTRYGMSSRLPRCRRTIMAGITLLTDNIGTVMVREGWQETGRGMTATAF